MRNSERGERYRLKTVGAGAKDAQRKLLTNMKRKKWRQWKKDLSRIHTAGQAWEMEKELVKDNMWREENEAEGLRLYGKHEWESKRRHFMCQQELKTVPEIGRDSVQWNSQYSTIKNFI